MSRGYAAGALPGTDFAAALDVIVSETAPVAAIPHLPERGVGARSFGRTLALTETLPAELGPRGWRLVPRVSSAQKMAREMLARDLALAEDMFTGEVEAIKIHVTGPWSLATAVELVNGHRAVTDRGARRDIAWGIAGSMALTVQRIHSRTGVPVIVQLDEPYLHHLREGLVPGTSDFDELPRVSEQELADGLRGVLEEIRRATGSGVEETIINQLGAKPCWHVASECGAGTTLVDRKYFSGTAALDAAGRLVESGVRLGVGIVTAGDKPDAEKTRAREIAISLAAFTDDLGLDRMTLVDSIDVCSAGPFVGCTLAAAGAALAVAHDAAALLVRDAGDL